MTNQDTLREELLQKLHDLNDKAYDANLDVFEGEFAFDVDDQIDLLNELIEIEERKRDIRMKQDILDKQLFDGLRFRPKITDAYDEYQRMMVQNRFDNQRRVERNAIYDKRLFDELKDKRKRVDPYDEYQRMVVQDKFKHNIDTQNIKYRFGKAMNEINDNKPLLRPIPKIEVDPLKTYYQKMLEEENKESYEYIAEHPELFKEKDYENNLLMINFPENEADAIETYNRATDKHADYEQTSEKKNDAIVKYFRNNIKSLQDIYDCLDKVFENELKLILN